MRDGNLIGPIIVAIGVIVAAMAFAIVTTLLETADSGLELRVLRLEADRDSAAEALMAATNEITRLTADLEGLRNEMSLMANQAPVAKTAPPPDLVDPAAILEEDFVNLPETEEVTEEMKTAKARFNKGITQPRNSTMMEILGPPRDSYSTDCQPVTSATLKVLLETRQVGTIKVTMLKPALESLERVLNRLKESDPDIFKKVGTAGALCARFIRGSTTSVSNHSWGSAIDLTLQGELDGFGDGGTQFGLLILAEYFNDEGWFWGAAYSREDSMHFEVGEETLRAWKAEGKL